MNKKNNKRIKLGLLGSLLLGTTFSIMLPIVSCSSSSGTELKVSDQNPTKLNAVKADILSYFTGVGNDQKTFESQKRNYENLNYDDLSLLVKNNLREIVTFGDSKWDDVVKNITLEKGTFPSNPGGVIPDIIFKINLNDGFTPASGTENNLNVLIPIGNSSTTRATELSVSVNNAGKVAFTNSIKNLFAFKTFEGQKEVYAGLNNKRFTDPLLTELKNILSFGSGNNWDKVVHDYEVTISNSPLISGQKIPPVTIKVELKWNYIATVSTVSNLTVVIDDLGNVTNATDLLTIAKVASFDTKPGAVEIKKSFIDATKTLFTQQRDAFLALNNRKLKTEEVALFKGLVTFTNSSGADVGWDNAVEDVDIILPTNPTITVGGAIPNISLKINLKSQYSSTAATNAILIQEIAFMTGETQDNFANALKIVAADAADKAAKIIAGSNKFKELFAVSNQTFAEQFEIYNNLDGEVLSSYQESLFAGMLTFSTATSSKATIAWNDVVKNMTISFASPAPTLTAGAVIPALTIVINLNIDYVANDDTEKAKLTFETNELGTFAQKGLTISDGADWPVNTIKNGLIEFIKQTSSGSTIEKQKANYNSLIGKTLSSTSTGVDKDAWDKLGGLTTNSPLLTFTYGAETPTWFDVVNSVTFTGATSEGATNIPDIKVNINLKNEYKAINTASEEKLTRTYTNLGAFDNLLIITKNPAWEDSTIRNGIINLVKDRGGSDRIDEQRTNYTEFLKLELSANSPEGGGQAAWNTLKGMLVFNLGSSLTWEWDQVVEKVTFSGAAITDNTIAIPDITMTIHLKTNQSFDYDTESAKWLTIISTDLGNFDNYANTGFAIGDTKFIAEVIKKTIFEGANTPENIIANYNKLANGTTTYSKDSTGVEKEVYDVVKSKLSLVVNGQDDKNAWDIMVESFKFKGTAITNLNTDKINNLSIVLTPKANCNFDKTSNLIHEIGEFSAGVLTSSNTSWAEPDTILNGLKDFILGSPVGTIQEQRDNYTKLIGLNITSTSAQNEGKLAWDTLSGDPGQTGNADINKQYLNFKSLTGGSFVAQKWNDIVEKVTFTGATLVGNETVIPDITMTIYLKTGKYTSFTGETLLTKTYTLGNFTGTITPLAPAKVNLESNRMSFISNILENLKNSFKK